MIRIMDHTAAGALTQRKEARLAEAEGIVAPMLAAIRARGDSAVLEYARQFDNFAGDLRVPSSECESALARLTPEFRAAVEVASKTVREFAALQLPRATQVEY